MIDLKVGDRIELLQMLNDPNPIENGSQGTVQFVSGLNYYGPHEPWFQVAVKWDNGRSLLLCVPPDRYRKL